MIRLRASVSGEDNVRRLLEGVERRAGDMFPVFRGPIDKLVTLAFTRQFATEGAWGGRPWPALSPRTLDAKARARRLGMGILRHTNRLWASLVKVGPESLRIVGRMSYERGTRVPYAVFHQIGTGRIPPRPLVPDPLPREFVRSIERLVAAYVEGDSRAGVTLGGVRVPL